MFQVGIAEVSGTRSRSRRTESDGGARLKISLEPFARECVESSFGSDLRAGTEAAIRHYARRLRSPRQPLAVPGFGRDGEARPALSAGAKVELELPLLLEDEAALRREARRQWVTVDRLVSHAIFVYFADLDAAASGAEPWAEEDAASSRYRFRADLRAQADASRRGGAAVPVPLRRPDCERPRARGGTGFSAG